MLILHKRKLLLLHGIENIRGKDPRNFRRTLILCKLGFSSRNQQLIGSIPFLNTAQSKNGSSAENIKNKNIQQEIG